MNSDLQAIMARRRQLSDLEAATKNVSADETNISSAVNAPTTIPILVSPIKENLKAVEMSSDLQAIMHRRRMLVEADPDTTKNLNSKVTATNIPAVALVPETECGAVEIKSNESLLDDRVKTTSTEASKKADTFKKEHELKMSSSSQNLSSKHGSNERMSRVSSKHRSKREGKAGPVDLDETPDFHTESEGDDFDHKVAGDHEDYHDHDQDSEYSEDSASDEDEEDDTADGADDVVVKDSTVTASRAHVESGKGQLPVPNPPAKRSSRQRSLGSRNETLEDENSNEVQSDEHNSSQGSGTGSLKKSAPIPDSSSRRRRVRRESSGREGNNSDENCADMHSVGSHNSGNISGSGAQTSSRPKLSSKSGRSSRRTSAGAGQGEKTTSLSSLTSDKHSRRRSIGDDCSKAESTSSRQSARRPGSKRSGRRKPTSEGSVESVASAETGANDQRSSMTTQRQASVRSVDSKENPAPVPTKTRTMTRRSSQRITESDDGGTKAPNKPRRDDKEKKKKEVVKSEVAGFGADFPSFPSAPSDTTGFSTDFGGFSADTEQSNFEVTEGFGNFEDTSFLDAAKSFNNKGSIGAVQTTTTTSTAVGTDFGATDAFGAFDMTGNAFSGDSNAFFSQTAPSFETPKVTNWDKSPLTDIPVRPESKLSLFSQRVLTAKFMGKSCTNPANGNIIFCADGQDGVLIHEIDPYRDYMQVASTPILSPDLQRKLAAKYSVSACSLETVIVVTAGLHYAHGHARVRVAAILDLRVVESHQVMRVVVVWQWGYATPHSIALQYALTPPSGGDFTYDSFSLQVADGLMFVAGSSSKGPCIFMCKPAVRETWSANFLPGIARITCMAVTPRTNRDTPYLAVAFNDRSVSIWTYKSALSGSVVKGNEPSKRWLFPLCRLDTQSLFSETESINLTSIGTLDSEAGVEATNDPGCCTDLAWLPPQPSVGNLPLIATTYQNGIAVFNVSLPLVADKSSSEFRPLPDPTPQTIVSQTPALAAVAIKRWQGDHDQAFATWLNVSPYDGPALGVLLHQTQSTGGAAIVAIGSLKFPLYRRGPSLKGKPIPIEFFSSIQFSLKADSYPMGLLHVSGKSTIELFSANCLLTVALRRKATFNDAAVVSLRQSISTLPPGLSSIGEPLLTDTNDDKDGVLHIFAVLQCERHKSVSNPSMQDWSRPRRRNWLCRTLVGDTKASARLEEAKEGDRGFGSDDVVKGGASSDVVCEIFDESIDHLLPLRLVRCKGASVCAIVYRSGLSNQGEVMCGLTMDGLSIAFIDFSASNTIIRIISGRDIAFAPMEGICSPHGWILSRDGSTLTFFSWDSTAKSIIYGSAFRPVVGVDTDVNYIEARRIFVFSGASTISLAVVGTRLRDYRTCFISGDLCPITDAVDSKWSVLLPNFATGRSLWLGENEEVFSMIGLECDDSGYRNFSLSTSARVIIITSALSICAEISTPFPAASLAPLGSFAVSFCSGNKLRYLCCLDGKFMQGAIVTLPVPQHGFATTMLTAVRPDRVLLAQLHNGVRLVEFGQNPNLFLLPTSKTWPALMLEPMVANAICVGGKKELSTTVLRTVVEKFGRKIASLTHGEDEGIGNLGAGLTPHVFEMLHAYGLHQAASWLLTGSAPFDRTANSRILPPWLPMAPKVNAALNSDALLHIVSNGDSYLSEYVKAPATNLPSTLPRQSDSTAYVCLEIGKECLRRGNALDAIKMLDLVGSTTSDAMILQIALLLKREPSADASDLLKSLCGYNNGGNFSRSTGAVKAPASFAALAISLRQSGMMNEEDSNRWMKPLAPSLQRGARVRRTRQSLFTENDLMRAGEKIQNYVDPLWATACNESKHVWNEGPRREKDMLLTLDSLEDWLGRQRPVIIGKEGASAALDRGEKTLADILNMGDDDSFGGKSDLESAKDDWVDGVGEGRTDEANLSGYFRFSEGEDEDSPWRNEGITDLSPYQNKAIIVGDVESVSLQPTTSSVDEGEAGKVKTLYDFVFNKAGDGVASGLAIKASRGSSLDIGVLHRADKSMRLKCSIEFWYFVPSLELVSNEMVLVRRTMGDTTDDLSEICLASNKGSVLWELRLRLSGELDFRTCGGDSLLSSQNAVLKVDKSAGEDSDDEKERSDLAVFGKWNHVCIVLATRNAEVMSKCSVAMYMKGEEVAASEMSLVPPNFDEQDVDEVMQKSYVIFGLNHCAGFRLTEIRIWACERSAEDTQSFLYEYLTAAEGKKKFKVKISNKNKSGGNKLGKGAFLAPPKGGTTTGITAPKTGGLAPPRGIFSGSKPGGMLTAPKSGGSSPTHKATSPGMMSHAHISKNEIKFSLAPPPDTKNVNEDVNPIQLQSAPNELEFFPGFNDFGAIKGDTPDNIKPISENKADEKPALGEELHRDEDEATPTTLWDTAIPLSQQVRSSAAAALIRGPPATRHFGGNRGGLPDFSGMERSGVGGIAICGSEKTIVWRDNEDPPALTYPIGASGAIVSDLMDDEGSEFLCCFLAKEKRMVVFELQSRTVVVELQMTTKLNFWRFLPPEAAENTLCFMLVTPVGGFHWMPLEESPRPHQVWKRGADLQGKKVVNYEEGGSNGHDGPDILSRVGLVMVTKATGGGTLEAWIVPIDGDSKASQVSEDVMGACFCQPPFVEDGPFLPLLVTVHHVDGSIYVNVLSVTEPKKGSVALGEIEVTRVLEDTGVEDVDFEPPPLAMGSFPEAICCSVGNIVVVIVRRKGLIAAFEIEEEDLSLIALEGVGHYVIDAVMRYSAEVGGAEIVMLLSDDDNSKDGRMVSFCFRSAT